MTHYTPSMSRQTNLQSHKRVQLNPYTPSGQISKVPIHSLVTFVSRREGNMKVSGREIIGMPRQPESEGEEFTYDFGDMDIFLPDEDNDSMTSTRRKRTARVCISNLQTFFTHQMQHQDNPLLTWMNESDFFLTELLWHDGRGDRDHDSDLCPGCSTSTPHQHRCQDCLDAQLYCCACIVKDHARLPTHTIQVSSFHNWIGLAADCSQEWNSDFFQCVSLKNMGLCVQLGHALGNQCILPQRAFNNDFVLINTNSIHEIGLDFCGCETSQTHTQQILRAGWFPSTSTDPRTAATFRVLHHYQILSFESKASAYEFYHSLVRLTDNTGLKKRKVSLNFNMAKMYHSFYCFRIVMSLSCAWCVSGVTW